MRTDFIYLFLLLVLGLTKAFLPSIINFKPHQHKHSQHVHSNNHNQRLRQPPISISKTDNSIDSINYKNVSIRFKSIAAKDPSVAVLFSDSPLRTSFSPKELSSSSPEGIFINLSQLNPNPVTTILTLILS